MTDSPDDGSRPSTGSASEPTDNIDSETFEAVDPEEFVDTDEWVQIHQAHYDRESDGELASALVFAIADAKGVDPLDRVEMPPLYESIDAQALEESFFGPTGVSTQRKEAGSVTFMYDSLKVALRSDGWIFVSQRQ